MTTLFESAEVRAKTAGRVVVMAWHRAPTAAAVRALEQHVAPHHDAYPDGVALVVLPLGPPPDQGGREALDTMMRNIGRNVVAATAVLPIPGMKGKLIRTAASGIVKTMRLPFGVKIADSGSAGAQHITTEMRARGLRGPSSDELAAVIAEIQQPLSVGTSAAQL
ncbi:MAG: hypothetical protein U0271_04810 [Polyangiaceae bacterium]